MTTQDIIIKTLSKYGIGCSIRESDDKIPKLIVTIEKNHLPFEILESLNKVIRVFSISARDDNVEIYL